MSWKLIFVSFDHFQCLEIYNIKEFQSIKVKSNDKSIQVNVVLLLIVTSNYYLNCHSFFFF